MKKSLLFFLNFLFISVLWSQILPHSKSYTKEDTLRGSLLAERSCFDVRYYGLELNEIDFDKKFIQGKVKIHADIIENTSKIQLDLFPELKVLSVYAGNKKLRIERGDFMFYVFLEREYKKGERLELEIAYNGVPRAAVNPPWDGGLTWTKDEYGRPWMSVSCQGLGASVWWPNKDHLSDEPDSMEVKILKLSNDLWSISNGTYHGVIEENDKEFFHFKINYPINNYNVAMYIGHYSHFTDSVKNGDAMLSLDYLVIRGNEEKAKKHFKMVPEMLTCFEQYFGPYPYAKDGFSLVEAPYAGMEHQSAIAYGNKYQKGYLGVDYSGIGLDFDFIIVHEAGHEYWGNYVSMKDLADMWIHEGFCTYAEVLYVECKYGYNKALEYINFKKNMVQADSPLLAPMGVNAMPTSDVYTKGALFLHTLRFIAKNDEQFFAVLKNIQSHFAHSHADTRDILNEFSTEYKRNLSLIFDVYLKQIELPTVEYTVKIENKKANLYARWSKVPDGFSMPVLFWYAGKLNKIELGDKDLVLIPKFKSKSFRWANEYQYVSYAKSE